jgi:methionyl-tRNA formyltransferase
MARVPIVFFGTADFACPSFRALTEEQGFEVLAAVTQPDRPKGRELRLQPPALKVEASRRSIPVLQPERARRPEFIAELSQLAPALIVVAAYGQILPQSLLDIPRFGCLNVHGSLLPKYRGAAPIQWAILNDELETGITIMKMDAGLDTGDMLTQFSIPIRPSDTGQTLHDKLASAGAELLVRTIPDYLAGKIQPRKQPAAGVSYARKITKEDGRLDWHQSSRTLWNRVRAFTPWPGAFTTVGGSGSTSLLKVWEAAMDPASGVPGEILSVGKNGIVVACRDEALRLHSLQREGSRRLSVEEFVRGFPLKPGMRLGA